MLKKYINILYKYKNIQIYKNKKKMIKIYIYFNYSLTKSVDTQLNGCPESVLFTKMNRSRRTNFSTSKVTRFRATGFSLVENIKAKVSTHEESLQRNL